MHYRQASDLGGQDRAKLTADDVRDIRISTDKII